MGDVGDRHRLEVAERQLALVQSFIPRIDAKVSALFAICSAQIAVAAINLTAADLPKWYVTVPMGVFLVLITGALIYLYRCAYPHLEGGQASVSFFVEIAKRREVDFIDEYVGISDSDLTKDICGQIWRNSQIASVKFGFLKSATRYAMLSVVPWALMLVATGFTNSRIPIVAG